MTQLIHEVFTRTQTTVKFLNFRMPENFAVIYLKFNQRDQTLGYFVKKMQMEQQTVKTLIRLLLWGQSDPGLQFAQTGLSENLGSLR